MRSIFHKAVLALLYSWLLGMLAASPVWARPSDEASALPVPARLSIAEGTVSFWRPGDQDWSAAQVNMALAAGDAIYAGPGATVEIQVGPRAYLRLMADTQITLVRQDAGLLQVNLAAGNASFDLRGTDPSQLIEIDTPNAAFSVNSNGYYRVDFRDGITRMFTRRGGRATLGLRDGYNRTIGPGEQIIVRGGTELTAELAAAPPPDPWDRWNDARSDYYDKSMSSRYLPPQVYGAADLDQYGSWSDVPEYGTVWTPTVAPGWAPYSVGYWRWDPVYEWTWIDAAPWGWAPSHYGRWVFIGGRWAWAPGPRVMRPVYMPAVVAFLGFGGGPQVGWVALSWGEPIVPWWGHSSFRGRPYWGGWGGPRMVNNTLVQNSVTINVNNITYRNSHVSQGVVTEPGEDFGRGQRRYHHFRFATPDDGRPAPVVGALPVRHERPPMTAVPPLAMPRAAMPASPTAQPVQPLRGTVSGGAVAPNPQMGAPSAVRQERPATTAVSPPGVHREQRPETRPSTVVVPPQPAVSETRPTEAPPRVIDQRRFGHRDSRPAQEQRQEPASRGSTVIVPQAAAPAPAPTPASPAVSRQVVPQAVQQAPARESRPMEAPRRIEAPAHEQRREEPRSGDPRDRRRHEEPGQQNQH